LSAENPSQATFDVHLRPLAGVPATDARALASSIRTALLPSLILTHHPRTLIQLVLQTLSSPTYSHSYWLQQAQAQSKAIPAGIGSDHALAAAFVNASTLALLRAGSVPMRGTVAAVSVGLSVTGELIINTDEDQLIDLVASGCFAFLFADRDTQCVWTSWKNVPTSNTRGVAGIVISQAREVARVEARAIRDEIKRQIVNMGKKEQIRIPSPPTKREKVIKEHVMEVVDDDTMEI
jgi:exosome complex component RRP46